MNWSPKFPKILGKWSHRPVAPSVPNLPFHSSPEEVEHLKSLRDNPNWRHYQALLERVAQAEYDQLATPLGQDRYHFQVGAYQASRRHVDLVDALITKWEEHCARSERDRDTGHDNRSAIFYGTALWESWRRDEPARSNGAG